MVLSAIATPAFLEPSRPHLNHHHLFFLQARKIVAHHQEEEEENEGKIGILVPQLCSECQIGPSTFKLVNLVPQFLFSGQTYPCGNVALHP